MFREETFFFDGGGGTGGELNEGNTNREKE
jgi:hypothetical protein